MFFRAVEAGALGGRRLRVLGTLVILTIAREGECGYSHGGVNHWVNDEL